MPAADPAPRTERLPMYDDSDPIPPLHPIVATAALMIVVYGLHAAGPYLEPLLFAVFLAVLGQGPTRWLTERGVPRALAVCMVVAALIGALVALAGLVAGSLASMQASFDVYQTRIAELVDGALHFAHAQGLPVTRADVYGQLEAKELAERAFAYAGATMTVLSDALSNGFLTLFTMALLLLESGDIAGKIRSLAGDVHADLSRYRRIGEEMQRYIGIKTVLSVATGLTVSLWLWVLDVDFVIVWGLVAFLLNYIPNIGSILAAVPACLLALLQHGPTTALAAAAGYALVNTVVGNVIEPVWLGRRLGLSTLVVFLSLVAWGALWGPLGMLLSVPLTMTVKILCEHSPRYQFVATLLGTHEDESVATWRTIGPEALSRFLAPWQDKEDEDETDRVADVDERFADTPDQEPPADEHRPGKSTEVSPGATREALREALEAAGMKASKDED